MSNNAPTFRADLVGDRLRFFCPHCKKTHLHGNGTGHRAAHCIDGPFKETGYILRVLSDGEAASCEDERSLLDDLRDAREAAIAAGDEPVDVRAMLAALDDDCEHCGSDVERESEDR